jgi:hypothetical protein
MPTITRERSVTHSSNHRTNDHGETTSIPPIPAESSIAKASNHTPEFCLGIGQVLAMRVGCWRPPVHVDLAS